MRMMKEILAWFGFDVLAGAEPLEYDGKPVPSVRPKGPPPPMPDPPRRAGDNGPKPRDVGLGIYHCKTCQRDRAGTEYEMTPFPTGGKDGCVTFEHGDVRLTLACGHVLAFTADDWERARLAAVARRKAPHSDSYSCPEGMFG